MPHLQHRQQKIQERRKQTPWREFVREICSWYPVVLYRSDGLLSRYPQGERKLNVVDVETHGQETDEAETYGLSLETDFFVSLKNLLTKVPLSAVFNTSYATTENAAYADIVSSSKNVYLSRNVTKGCENVWYSVGVKDGCCDVMNSLMVWDHSDIVYASRGVINSHSIFYSQYIYNSTDIRFCTNMMNCQHCLFCNDLENTSYCIDNVQYEKEVYFEKKEILLREKHMYPEYRLYMDKHTPKNFSSHEVEGTFIIHSQEVAQSMFVYNTKRGHNMILGGYSFGEEDIYDALFCGSKSHVYGIVCCGSKSEYLYSCIFTIASMQMFYCYDCHSCSYCFGCVGLRNKSFCILNRQYTKEERYQKVDEIFIQMEKDEILGDFFPGSMNPFYFNDTAAYLIDDTFTKEEVEAEGYLWRDEEVKVDIPEGVEVVTVDELASYESRVDGQWWIDPDILHKVIQDEQGNVYRIVKMEYDFLMKHGLSLPRLHRLERLKMNFKIK